VTPARETWHCFGCGEGGDIFSFVMRRDGVAFPEALRRLAQRAGVEIDERTTREDAHRKRLHEVLDTAFAFYHAVLMNSETGAPALAYLRGRVSRTESIERAQLGFAPPDWDALVRTLERKRQIGPAELTEVGLAMPRRSGARRLRSLPGPGPLPDPRRDGQFDRSRRPHPAGRSADGRRPGSDDR